MKLKAILMAVGLIAATMSGTAPVEASIISQARAYQGLHERMHTKRLKKLLGVNPISTPWCGAFTGMLVRKVGKAPPASYRIARSWLRYGSKTKLSNARPGDIVVVRTGRGYHVGIFVSKTKGFVNLIGGNQSNRVQISRYPTRSIAAVRR
jgi:uncharacterized protein (TIGR02594 family)